MTRRELLYWALVLSAFLIVAFLPSPASGDSNSGLVNLTVLVVANEIDRNLSGPWVLEATEYLVGVNITLNWSTPYEYLNLSGDGNSSGCGFGYYKCIYLGGHLALGNMSNVTDSLLDRYDREYIMFKPSLINLPDGRRFVLAGSGRDETAEAARRYADDVLP